MKQSRVGLQWGRIFSLLTFIFFVFSSPALAQTDGESANSTGIVGGAFLGAETVLIVESLAGVEPAWAYIAGGTAGAIGGAFGGLYIQENTSTEVSMALLIGGLALVIPTSILVLNATAYKQPKDFTEDDSSQGTSAGLLPSPTQAPSLVALGFRATELESFSLSVPNVELRPTYTVNERLQFGLANNNELHLSLLHGTF